MKILLVGSDQIWSIEKIYDKWLAGLRQEIELFPAQNQFYAYYQQSIFNKLLYRAGFSRIIGHINTQLREAVTRFRPDAILVFKGMEILPSTLLWIREQRIPLANYNPDNPFFFSGTGSGNRNVTVGIPFYDLHFTYNLEIKERLEREYKIPAVYLPFGFDVREGLYEIVRQQDEVPKVCFLGNPDDQRVAMLVELLQRGVGIDVYGHHWSKFIRHEKLRIYDAVYGDEFWKVLRRYRIQVNLLRPHNLQSHNMRTFEIPGIGGIQLAPDTPEHRQFFTPDREIFLFRDAAECYEKIQGLLELSPEGSAAVRQAARTRSITSGYTYKDRAHTVLDSIRDLAPAPIKERSY